MECGMKEMQFCSKPSRLLSVAVLDLPWLRGGQFFKCFEARNGDGLSDQVVHCGVVLARVLQTATLVSY
jgi:hypothetical protein